MMGLDRNELIELEEGELVLRAYPGPDCGDDLGTIHGGFLLALVDIVRCWSSQMHSDTKTQRVSV